MLRSTFSMIRLTSSRNETPTIGYNQNSESEESVSILPESAYSDFVYYLTRRTRIRSSFSNFIFVFFVVQETIVGLMPNFDRYWRHDKSTQKLVRLLGYIFLVLSPNSHGSEYNPLLITLAVLFCFSFVILIVCYILFTRNRTIPRFFCYLHRYPALIVSTILFPIMISFCGEYLNDVFNVQEFVNGEAATFFIFIFLIVVIINMIETLLFMHFTISFQDSLFRIWRPYSVIRLYVFLGLVPFLNHIFTTTEKTWFSTLPLAVLVISVINFGMEINKLSWANENQQIYVLSAILSAIVSPALILLDTLFSNNEEAHPKIVFWLCLLLCFFSNHIVRFFLQKAAKRILKRLDDPDYINVLKSEKSNKSLYHDICIGLQYGHPIALSMDPISDVLSLYPNSFDIYFLLAKHWFAFSNSPIPINDIVEGLSSGFQFNPLKSHVVNSIRRSMSPNDPESKKILNNDIASLSHTFHRLIESIRSVYDLILNELTRSLPKAILAYQYRYKKLTKRLFKFVQKYPGSPDADFFIELFSLFFPNSPELKELHFWQNDNPNYVNLDLSVFPSHLSSFFKQPDIFQSYDRKYEETTRKIPPNLFKYDSFHVKNQMQLSNVKGPYNYVVHRFFLFFPLILSVLFPLVVMIMMQMENREFLSRRNHLMKCYSMLWHIYQMNNCLYPSLFFKNNTKFWKKYDDMDSFMINKLDSISKLQDDLLLFGKGIGSHVSINKHIFRLFSEVFEQHQNSNSTGYQIMMQMTFVANDFLTSDCLYLKYDPDLEYGYKILDWVYNNSMKYAQDFYRELRQFVVSGNCIFNFNPLYLLIPEYVFMITMHLIAIFSIKNAVSKLDLFFITLRETSKAAITKVLSDFQKCQHIVSSNSSLKRKHWKLHQFDFVLFFTIPLSIVYTIMIILIAMFTVMSACYLSQIENSVTNYDKLVFAYSNFSDMVISTHILQFYPNLTDSEESAAKNIFEEVYKQYEQIDWFVSDSKKPFCPVCSLVDVLMSSYSYDDNTTFYTIIYEWLGMAQYWADVISNVESVSINLIIAFYNIIDPMISSSLDKIVLWSDSSLQKTENILISIVVLYVLAVIFLAVFSELVILKADSPFKSVVKLLGQLPENALSKDTVKILNNQSWRFASKQFEFDPMYYEQVLRTLPDPVVVIDRLMNIISFNTAARQLINIPVDDAQIQQVQGKYKLFEVMALDLCELPPVDVDNTAAMQPHPQNQFQPNPQNLNPQNLNQQNLDQHNLNQQNLNQQNLNQQNLNQQNLNQQNLNQQNLQPNQNQLRPNNNILMPSFCDIVEDYLYDDSCTIITRRLGTSKGKSQKLWFSLTIQPIDDEFAAGQRDSCRYALVFKDIGEETRQQKMLEQEAEKHFQIVNQILPTEVAKRLLREQHSISMTVETVAISFCDIVSFTPWCGSQSPETVVTTLNHMFKMFDKICAKYEEVTKIKCIGDCYMSAAGIFSPAGSEPEVAARQMVHFCLDLIDAIEIVNQQLRTTLQVRIGVAYGGPISAGVMGMHKPVFDIWGEIVNEANAMESGGKPMKVHITSHLYDVVKNENIHIEPGDDGSYFVTRE